jgi:hypothetical protein
LVHYRTGPKKRQQVADEVHSRLASLLDKEEEGDFPDTIDLTKESFEKWYPLWALWRSTEKRHLLSELLLEPEEPWKAVLEIEHLFGILENGKRREKTSADSWDKS